METVQKSGKMPQENVQKNRTYIAIDLKSFYASVECVARNLDPLKARLVVADPTRTEKTICLAVSPALKAFGIPGRARVFEVNQKLKEHEARTGEKIDYVMAPPRMARYMEISSQIFEIYLRHVSAEDVHVYSVDECFIDVTDYLSLYHLTAHELTMRMIKDVLAETGITATAGIGTNMYLAKIAMDIVAKHMPADENGVRIAQLDEMSYRRLLWSHTPLTDFWRCGPGISRRLQEHHMFTMGDVARVSITNEAMLYKVFGIDAEILIDHAWGYEPCTIADIKNYKSKTNCISSGQVLQHPYDVEKARLVVQEMTDLVVLDLVEKGVATDSVTVSIGYDREKVDSGQYHGKVDLDRYGRKIPKGVHGTASFGTFTSSTKKIMAGVLEVYDRIVDPRLTIRRLNITANNLREQEFEQIDWFTDPKDLEKEKKLQKMTISLKKKFGKNALLKGMNLSEGATTIERNNQIGGHKA